MVYAKSIYKYSTYCKHQFSKIVGQPKPIYGPPCLGSLGQANENYDYDLSSS